VNPLIAMLTPKEGGEGREEKLGKKNI